VVICDTDTRNGQPGHCGYWLTLHVMTSIMLLCWPIKKSQMKK